MTPGPGPGEWGRAWRLQPTRAGRARGMSLRWGRRWGDSVWAALDPGRLRAESGRPTTPASEQLGRRRRRQASSPNPAFQPGLEAEGWDVGSRVSDSGLSLASASPRSRYLRRLSKAPAAPSRPGRPWPHRARRARATRRRAPAMSSGGCDRKGEGGRPGGRVPLPGPGCLLRGPGLAPREPARTRLQSGSPGEQSELPLPGKG